MTDIVKKVYDTVDDNHRVFLVVVDDSEEMLVALRFACMRAKSVGGRVALFRDIEPSDCKRSHATRGTRYGGREIERVSSGSC